MTEGCDFGTRDPAARAYYALRQRLRARAAHERILLSATMELTARCNLRCAHCYINEPAGDAAARDSELTTAEVRRVIDELVDEGCLWLLLTGGEPLLRADFREVFTHAKRRGLLVSLNTNGVLVTAELAAFLAEWPPLQVELSLYGATPETYERVTRSPGTFQRCLEAIDLLRSHRIPLGLKTVCTTENQHELAALRALAGARGLSFRYDPEIMCRLDGDGAPARLRLAPAAAIALDRADPERWDAWRRRAAAGAGAAGARTAGTPPGDGAAGALACGAGVFTAHVDASGRMSPCMTARASSYDLRRGTVREAWRTFMPAAAAGIWPANLPCATCDLRSVCNHCPAWARLETGRLDRPAEYQCALARVRAAELARAARGEETT